MGLDIDTEVYYDGMTWVDQHVKNEMCLLSPGSRVLSIMAWLKKHIFLYFVRRLLFSIVRMAQESAMLYVM